MILLRTYKGFYIKTIKGFAKGKKWRYEISFDNGRKFYFTDTLKEAKKWCDEHPLKNNDG